MFRPVTRHQNRLRMAIDGPAGSGKTYTALRFAFALAGPEGRVAVIDTEHGSAAKYEGESPDGIPWRWDGCDLEYFAPTTYTTAIQAAGKAKYDVLVIDSLSHAWTGTGGALDQVDRSSNPNRFTAWKDVTPAHNAMVESILQSVCHVIATLRSRMEYVLEPDENGKMVPRKVGTKPVQREGIEYEFDVIADMDLSNTLRVSKTRCPAVNGKIVPYPGADFMVSIKEWLFSGAPRPTAPPTPTETPIDPTTRLSPATAGGSGGPSGEPGLVLDATPEMCDETLAGEIRHTCKVLDWEPEKLREVLSKRGAAKLSDLTVESAKALLDRLWDLRLKKEGQEAF